VLAYIDSKDIKIPSTEISPELFTQYNADIIEIGKSNTSNDMSPNHYEKVISPNMTDKYITEADIPDLKILFENVQPYYQADHQYVLFINGQNFVIPPEYNEIAEKYVDYQLFPQS